MTTGPAASRSQDNSLLGIGASALAVFVAVLVGKWTGEQDVTPYVIPLAMAVPPAIQLRIKSRHRDKNVDIARVQQGVLRRPVGLVVMLLAAAIVLIDSALGVVEEGIGIVLKFLVHAGKIEKNIATVVGGPLMASVPMFWGICLFLFASYASHYFAKRPYLWTAIAVGCALTIRELVVLAFRSTSGVKSWITDVGSLPGALVAVVLTNLVYLFICMVGVWLGKSYHDAFLAKKLARMEGKAAREAAKQHQSTPQSQTTATPVSAQDSNASQNSAPKLVTLLSRHNDLPSAPDNHRTSRPFKEIKKLAQLRETGALTEEEFQAKKSEILGRI